MSWILLTLMYLICGGLLGFFASKDVKMSETQKIAYILISMILWLPIALMVILDFEDWRGR